MEHLDGDQLSRRQAAADRHDAALTRWPNRQGDGFAAELQAVVAELGALIAEMPPGLTESVEWARTLRWLADAYFDLARGTEATILARGRAIYERSDALLGAADPMERAKLHTSWANTLRSLAGTEDRALAGTALEKYRTARALYARHEPQRVGMLDDLIGSLEGMVHLMGTRDALANNPPPAGDDITKESVAALRKQIAEAANGLKVGAGQVVRATKRLAEGTGVELDMSEVEKLVAQVLSGDGGSHNAAIFDALRARFEKDLTEGKVDPARAEALRAILDELGKMTTSGAEAPEEIAAQLTKMRGLFNQMNPLVGKPSHGLPAPPVGSRAARVVELWSGVRDRANQLALASGAGDKTKAAAFQQGTAIAKVDRDIYVAGDDDAATIELERERLRPIAAETRRLALVHNLTLAAPDFHVGNVSQAHDLVFHSGGAETRALASGACRRTGMRLQDEALGEDVARTRWRQLREAAVAVFDFTPGKSPRERGAIAYELGLARALGVPVVVLATNAKLPFDVAVTPLVLSGDDELELAEAIDRASYWIPSEVGDKSGMELLAPRPCGHGPKRSVHSRAATAPHSCAGTPNTTSNSCTLPAVTSTIRDAA